MSYSVTLLSYGGRKIAVIKEIRSITGLGLKESKHFVESLPQLVKSSLDHCEAEDIAERLRPHGATVEIMADADAPPSPPPQPEALYKIVLRSYGRHKIPAIKAVREVTSLGLKDAKELVEQAPNCVLEKVSRSSADAFMALINGTTVEAEVTGPTEASVESPNDDSFDIVMEAFGNRKIAVIKVLREFTGMGLADAKTMVESAPVTLGQGMSYAEAQALKDAFEQAGAIISMVAG